MFKDFLFCENINERDKIIYIAYLTGSTQKDIARELGVCQQYISAVIHKIQTEIEEIENHNERISALIELF